jgi:tetratricopeptide (TPR) repeat protein
MQNREDLNVSCNQNIPDHSSSISLSQYIELGQLFHDQKKWGDSESAYQKAVDGGWVLNEKDYLRMGHAQFQQSCYDNAILSYQNALRVNPNFIPAYRQMVKAFDKAQRFNPRAYFINPKLKLIYCRIPKNACTVFTTMLVENSDEFEAYSQSGLGPHDYLSASPKALRLTDYAVLRSSEYLKFTILRDPFKRLVSGYLDKFAKSKNLEKFARDVVQKVNANYHTIKCQHSITFSQFVEYLIQTDDYDLDPHWRPQYTFLAQGLFEFDIIGQFEKLDLAIDRLEKSIGFPIRKDVSVNVKRGHVTKYEKLDCVEKFHNCDPEIFRSTGKFPNATQLYTHELERLVRLRYAKDIEFYERQFNLSIESYS